MFALGDQVQVQRMRMPSDAMRVSEKLCRCSHHAAGQPGVVVTKSIACPDTSSGDAPTVRSPHGDMTPALSPAESVNQSSVRISVAPRNQSAHAARKRGSLAPSPSKVASSCECCRSDASLAGVSWPALFLHIVVSHRVVPLALYRDRVSVAAPGLKAAHDLPFVHTNPRLSGRVHVGDRLFVVAPQGVDA